MDWIGASMKEFKVEMSVTCPSDWTESSVRDWLNSIALSSERERASLRVSEATNGSLPMTLEDLQPKTLLEFWESYRDHIADVAVANQLSAEQVFLIKPTFYAGALTALKLLSVGVPFEELAEEISGVVEVERSGRG
jgi:hypothetical protein